MIIHLDRYQQRSVFCEYFVYGKNHIIDLEVYKIIKTLKDYTVDSMHIRK